MPLTKITITHRHVRVHTTDSTWTGNDDPGRNEEVRRGHGHVFARHRARTEDDRNDTESNENRTRGAYRHVPSRSPSSSNPDRNRPGQTKNVFHTSSRQAPPREQIDPRRQPSHRTEQSYNTIHINFRRAPLREQQSENTTSTHRQAPPREPTHQTRNSSHRNRWSDHIPHHPSPRQAPAPSEEQPNLSESSNYPPTSSPRPVAPKGGDLYKTLKVSPEASHAEIVLAARRRRIQVHPDRLKYPGMTQSAVDRIDNEAQNVGLAADTLCDEVSRGRYDRAVRRGLRS